MKFFNFEKGILKTEKRTGRVVSGEELMSTNEGDSSDISMLDVSYGDKNEHVRSFVIKDFQGSIDPDSNIPSAKKAVTDSVRYYGICKKAGLPTYQTYRAEKDGTAILMTNLNKAGEFALSSNNPAPLFMWEEEDKWRQFEKLEGFEECIRETLRCAKVAGDMDIFFENDVYFFILELDSMKIKPFIGDFEGMNHTSEGQDTTDVYTFNERYALKALDDFVEMYIDQKNQNIYKTMINKYR